MIGQGIVLMVAGMGIVYAFLYLLIVVSELASRFVSRFDYIVADCEQKRQPNKHRPQPEIQNAVPTKTEGTPVAAPVPGTVLRLTAANGQVVSKDEEILALDVMKMETPITAPCAGCVTIRVAVMDKVATGNTLAVIG